MTNRVGIIKYFSLKVKSFIARISDSSLFDSSNGVKDWEKFDFTPEIESPSRAKTYNQSRVNIHNIYVNGKKVSKTFGEDDVIIINGKRLDPESDRYKTELEKMRSFELNMNRMGSNLSKMGENISDAMVNMNNAMSSVDSLFDDDNGVDGEPGRTGR